MRKALFLLAILCMPVSAKARTRVDMGICKCTAYCACAECSEGYGDKTASGTTADSGRTVAVDPDVIDIGSQVEIGGHIYAAEDRGSGVTGDHIDIYMDDHAEVEAYGVQYKHVWVVRQKQGMCLFAERMN